MVAEVNRAALGLMMRMSSFATAWTSPRARALAMGAGSGALFMVRAATTDRLGAKTAWNAGGVAALALLWDLRLRSEQAFAAVLPAFEPLYLACLRLVLDGPAELHAPTEAVQEAASELAVTYVSTRWRWLPWARPTAIRRAEQKLVEACQALIALVAQPGQAGRDAVDG